MNTKTLRSVLLLIIYFGLHQAYAVTNARRLTVDVNYDGSHTNRWTYRSYAPFTSVSLYRCLEEYGYDAACNLLRDCAFPEDTRISFVTAQHYDYVIEALADCNRQEQDVLRHRRGTFEHTMAMGELTRLEGIHVTLLLNAFSEETSS